MDVGDVVVAVVVVVPTDLARVVLGMVMVSGSAAAVTAVAVEMILIQKIQIALQ